MCKWRATLLIMVIFLSNTKPLLIRRRVLRPPLPTSLYLLLCCGRGSAHLVTKSGRVGESVGDRPDCGRRSLDADCCCVEYGWEGGEAGTSARTFLAAPSSTARARAAKVAEETLSLRSAASGLTLTNMSALEPLDSELSNSRVSLEFLYGTC